MPRAIFERLTCEKGLVVLPDAGHMLPVEYLGLSAPLVAEWLKSHLAVRAAQITPEATPSEKSQGSPAPRKRAAPAKEE
jgi:hypothetical protein